MKSRHVRLALFLAAAVLPAALFAQPTTSGSIYGTETWDASMNPIIVTGDITVENGATLRIGHGCDVRFQANSDDTHWGWDIQRSEIIVYGTIDIDGRFPEFWQPPQTCSQNGGNTQLIDSTVDFASELVGPGAIIYNTTDGTEGIVTDVITTTNPNDTLVITAGMSGGGTNDTGDAYEAVVPAVLTSTSTGANGWLGIIFSDNTATGTITFANMDHSVFGLNFTACDGPLYTGFTPYVSDCTINDVSIGMYFDDDSSPSINDTTIIHAETAFSCWALSSPNITNCNAANLTGDAQAVYATEWSAPQFIGCAFSAGSVELDRDADVYMQDSTISDAEDAVIGHETLIFQQAKILSYCGIELNNCNVIGLGDQGNGIEWDDNLYVCKVEYSRIGGFENNVMARWGSIQAPGIPHMVGVCQGGADPNNIDLGVFSTIDPCFSWPPGYVSYSAGYNEFYGVQNPDTLFNVQMEQSAVDPPNLYQLDIWAENNWWVTTNPAVISRYIWDKFESIWMGLVHYTASILPNKRTYSVSGSITDNLGDPVEGVRVWVDISAQFPGHTVLADITGDDGYYTIYGLLPSATAYTVVADKLFYAFTPQTISVTINPAQPSDITGQDFSANLPRPKVTIAGRDPDVYADDDPQKQPLHEERLGDAENWGYKTEATHVVISGLNFRETPSVFLEALAPLTGETEMQNVQWETSTTLKALVPAGLDVNPGSDRGFYTIKVVNPDGQDAVWGDASNPGFTILAAPPPEVHTISPNVINVTEASQWLSIAGEHFQSGCSVTIDGTTWEGLSPTEDGTKLSVWHEQGTLPQGIWTVTVINPDGQSSTDLVTLTVTGPPPPVVDSVDPVSGPNNRVTPITIYGSGFQDTPEVMVGTVDCLNESYVDSGTITAEVPIGITPGIYDVVVTNPDSGSGTCTACFTVTEPAVEVIGLSPPMGLSTQDTEIIVVGENFKDTPGPTVTIDPSGVPTVCTNVRVISSTCLKAVVPSGITPGLYDLEVDNNDGNPANTLTNAYTVVGAPTVSSITYVTGGGDVNNTTNININGSGFIYIPTVDIGTTRCTDVTFVSAAQLNANVPTGLTPGTYDVTVNNPLGQSGALLNGYTANAVSGEPEVYGVTPSTGTNDGETSVTITGAGFAGATGADLEGTALTGFTVVDDTEITATVPAGMRVGSYDLTITNPTDTGTLTHGFTAGGSATLNANTTLMGTVSLTGDVVVPDGYTLTIEPGAVLIFDAVSDDTSGGWDTQRGEIRVYGRVNVLGEADEKKVALTSDGAKTDDWFGIVFSDTNANGWIEYANITSAVSGLQFESSFSGVPAADNPRPWVSNVTVANCSTGIALDSSVGFSCPAIDTSTIDGVATGIRVSGTAAPIFTTALIRNVTTTGLEGLENAIVVLDNSSIVDAPEAVSCPEAATGEDSNASRLNIIFSVLGNGTVVLSDSALLTGRMVTHLLFPDLEDITTGIQSAKAAGMAWDYSNIVQGYPTGIGVDWSSEGDCAISNTVVANWGTGIKVQIGCGTVDLGDSAATGGNEFLGILNPSATFNIYNNCTGDMNAQYNWWLTTDTSVIDNYLYDDEDDSSLGNVDYSNYLSSPRTYSVSGRITDATGSGVDRVQVVAYGATPYTDNDRMALTDNDGDYTIYGLVPGSYTVTPQKQDYTFNPTTLSVTLTDTDLNGQDISATLPPPSVYGIRRTDGQELFPYGNHWAYNHEATDVVISGVNFRDNAQAALLGPLPDTTVNSITNVSVVSSTQITATIAAGFTAGGYGVRVTNSDAQSGTWGDDVSDPAITIIPPPPPEVDSISPAVVNMDFADPFIVSGDHFYGHPEVHIGDAVAYYWYDWDPDPTATTLYVRLSAADLENLCDLGPQAVQVFNPDGQRSNDDVTLTVNGPPYPEIDDVDGVTPDNGPINELVDVVITGNAFVATPEVTFTHTVSGKEVAAVNETYVSSNEITAQIYLREEGVYDVTLCNPPCSASNGSEGKCDTLSGAYTATIPPVEVIGVSPPMGLAAADTDIIVVGRNFKASPGPTVTVDPSGTPTACTNVKVISSTCITATVPAGITPGLYEVEVDNNDPGQPAGSLANVYTVTGPPQSIAAVGFPVDENKSSPITVTCAGAPNAPFAYIPSVHLEKVDDSGTVSSAGTNVLVDSAKSWTADQYEDAIVRIISGSSAAGQVRRIAGNDATTLTLTEDWDIVPSIGDGYEIVAERYRCAEVTFVSGTQLSAIVPSGVPAGGYFVAVTNPLDIGNKGGATYTVSAAPAGEPVVTGVAPASGANNGETDVTISGTNFLGTTGVTLDGTALTDVTVVDDTEITATVPPGMRVGSFDLDVTNATGTGALTHGFTVGGSGTLDADTFIDGTVTLTGDVVVPDGITLTVEPGSVLVFKSNSDDTSGGWDAERGEVRVYGRLDLLGAGIDERVALTSDGGQDSDWLGIVFSDTNASGFVDYADITNAVYGLQFESSLAAPITASHPRPWVRDSYIATCATGIGLNSSVGDTSPAFDNISIDNVVTGISAGGTASPVFTTTLVRNASQIGLAGKEKAIAALYDSSIVDAPKAVYCPDAAAGEDANQSYVNLIFSLLGNGSIETADSASLASRMVTHLLFPDEDVTTAILGQEVSALEWHYSNIVQGNESGIGVDWRSAGECNVSNTVFENWGVGFKSSGGCGDVNLGSSAATGGNEFLGIMNPLATYNVSNNCPDDVSAQYNWWLTTDTSVIDNYLYDQEDNPSLGNIDYSNYLTEPRTYSVSGRITDSSGDGVDRVQVVAYYPTDHTDNDRIGMTDEDGYYTIYGLVPTDAIPGEYTVRPWKQGYTFTPGTISIEIEDTDVNGQDITANLPPPIVYGIARADGQEYAPYGTRWAYNNEATSVVVNGIEFREGATVELIGPLPASTAVVLTGVQYVNSTSLTATVQASLTAGGYGVRVTNPDTQSDTWGDDVLDPAFTIIPPPPPEVYSITPPSVYMDYDHYLTVSGANFYGFPEVHIGSVTAYYDIETFYYDPPPTDTTLYVRVLPADLESLCDLGPQAVQVFNPDGQGSNDDVTLTVNGPPPPSIEGVSPPSGEYDTAVTITITGESFIETPDVYLVPSGGGNDIPCDNVEYTDTYEITADVPAGIAEDIYGIKVCNPPCSEGAPQNCDTYDAGYTAIKPPLGIFRVAPSRGADGGVSKIVLIGRTFEAATEVRVNGVDCTDERVASGEVMSALVPASTLGAGTFDVAVSSDGWITSETLTGAYESVVEPTVSTVNPNFSDNNDTEPVAIAGSGFARFPAVGLQKLYDNGTASGSTSSTLDDASKSWSADEFQGQFVAILTGTGANQKRSITGNDANTLTVSPDWGVPPDATSTYEIVGERYPCVDVGYTDSSNLTASVPSGLPADTYRLMVTNPLDQTGILEGAFVVSDAPTGEVVVSSISPPYGLNDIDPAGTDVTITGSNFTDDPPLVWIGATACTNIQWQSSTEITATVPAGINIGSYDVIVGGGVSTGTLTHGFSVGGAGTLPAGTTTTISGTVVFTGDVIVPATSTLVIEEGSVVLFESMRDDVAGGWDILRGELNVRGTLYVNGTEFNRVQMLSTENAADNNDWFGIVFSDYGSTGIISYANIGYGVFGVNSTASGPDPDNLLDTTPHLVVEDCVVSQSAVGFFNDASSSPEINRCSVVEVGGQGNLPAGFYLIGLSEPVVTDCTVSSMQESAPAVYIDEYSGIEPRRPLKSVINAAALSSSDLEEGGQAAVVVMDSTVTESENGVVGLAEGLVEGFAADCSMRLFNSNIVGLGDKGAGITWLGHLGPLSVERSRIGGFVDNVLLKTETYPTEDQNVDLGGGVRGSAGFNEFFGVQDPQTLYNIRLDSGTTYDLDVYAEYCWWLTDSWEVIERYILDDNEDEDLGNVTFSPYFIGRLTYSISGTVSDPNGDPIKDARVESGYSCAVTNSNGYYTLYGLLPGVNTVELNSPFTADDQTQDVTITDSDVIGADFVSALPSPVVFGVNPASGYTDVSTDIDVTGINFKKTPKVYLIGPLPDTGTEWALVDVEFINVTNVGATVQAGFFPGDYGLRLENPDGQSYTFGASEDFPAYTVLGEAVTPTPTPTPPETPTPTPTGPTPTPTSSPAPPTPTRTPTPKPTSTPVPKLRIFPNPENPKLFNPFELNCTVEPYGGTVDAWGLISMPNGQTMYLKGPPPCTLTAIPTSIANGVNLPGGWAGTLVSTPSIPLGYEGTYIVLVGLVNPGVVPTKSSDFISRYWEQRTITVRMP